jgi:hypothetical protein
VQEKEKSVWAALLLEERKDIVIIYRKKGTDIYLTTSRYRNYRNDRNHQKYLQGKY